MDMAMIIAVFAFLFMMSFLISIRSIVNKNENTTFLIVITSLLFGGGIFWAGLLLQS